MANLQRESNDGFLLAASVQDASGKDVDLSTYKGKLLLIVNVASQWYEKSSAEARVFLTFLLFVILVMHRSRIYTAKSDNCIINFTELI